MDGQAASLFNGALRELKDAGAELVEIDLGGDFLPVAARTTWPIFFHETLPAVREFLAANEVPVFFEEIYAGLGEHMKHSWSGSVVSSSADYVSDERYWTALNTDRQELRRRLASIAFEQADALLFPTLAQHAIREARHLAENIRAVIDGQIPSAFVFRSLGTMASLGHTRAVARVFGVRLTGFLAWWLRRTYYLFQMPRWDRRLRIVLDWTVAVFFRPDITRVDLRVEREQVKQARQLVDRSPEIVRAMQIESGFRAPSVNAIPGVDEPARRMHLS